jgi:hypothetical protein
MVKKPAALQLICVFRCGKEEKVAAGVVAEDI